MSTAPVIKIKEELMAAFSSRVGTAKADRDGLLSAATEVVVFGSRALGVNSRTSDLDVLCVTRSRRKVKTRELDCICIQSEDWNSPYWLGCELASHIASYGIWIVGSDEWRSAVQITSETVQRKERRVVSLISSVKRTWPALHSLFQMKYRVTIRRELQRLRFLQGGVAVPPTPILDLQWRSGEQLPHGLLEIAGVISQPDHSRFVAELLTSANVPTEELRAEGN